MQLPKEIIVYQQKYEQSLNLSHAINLQGCLMLIEFVVKCLSQSKNFSAQGLILIYSKHMNIWALTSIINKLASLIFLSHCQKYLVKYKMYRPWLLDPALILLAPGSIWSPQHAHNQDVCGCMDRQIIFKPPVDSCSELTVLSIKVLLRRYLVSYTLTFVLSLLNVH